MDNKYAPTLNMVYYDISITVLKSPRKQTLQLPPKVARQVISARSMRVRERFGLRQSWYLGFEVGLGFLVAKKMLVTARIMVDAIRMYVRFLLKASWPRTAS